MILVSCFNFALMTLNNSGRNEIAGYVPLRFQGGGRGWSDERVYSFVIDAV